MSQSTELATIEAIALPVKFAAEEVTDAIENIRRAALAEADGLDISRPGDRDKIKSVAYRVSKSKAAMEKLGKSLSDRRKDEIADEVNAIMVERKRIESELDALRDQIRAPVTEWEQKEEARIAEHEAEIAHIQWFIDVARGGYPASEYLSRWIDDLELYLDLNPRDWQEFQGRAEQTIAFARKDLAHKLERAKAAEAAAAELESLRAAEVERQRRHHEAQIAAVAAENAKREAEEKARADAVAKAARVEAERVAAETAARDERERIEDAAQAEREASAKREAAIEAQRKQAELDRIAAENAAKRAEEQRIADAEAAEQRRLDDARIAEARAEAMKVAAGIEQAAAIETERKRVAKIAADEDAARVKREADAKHRGKVNAAARDALMEVIAQAFGEHDGNEDGQLDCVAVSVVKAIARGQIPHVRLEY